MLKPHLIYLLPLFFFRKKLIISLAVLALGAGYTYLRCPPITLPPDGVKGMGYLVIDSVQPFASPFKKLMAVRGHFKEFQTDTQVLRHVPCHFFDAIPPAACSYLVDGKLLPKDHDQIAFKPTKDRPWHPVPATFSLAKWRFELKEKLRHFLHRMIPDPHAANYINTLATGEIDDRLITLEFRKVGLSHALAVSGVQFVLIALLLQRLLRFILPLRLSCLIVLLSLTGYFIFLGSTPPILRAYICIVLVLIAQFYTLPIHILNIVGGALLIELIVNPLHLKEIGFQLTFLCTLGLILFSKPLEKIVHVLLPKRPFSQISTFSLLDQHGCLFTSLIRKSLTTSLSAHLMSLPILFAAFGTFPLLSLLYNLFFPAALILTLILLLLALLLGPFGGPIHQLNSFYTSELLRLIGNPPEILNFSLNIDTFPFPLAVACVTVSLWFGLLLTKRDQSGLNR